MVEIKLSYLGGGHKYPNGKTFCSDINRPMFHELVIEMDFPHISIAYPHKLITLTLHHYTGTGYFMFGLDCDIIANNNA